MPRRKAPPRRNEGVGVEATSTPPARKKSRSGTRHPPLAEPVEVAIRERRPEDVVVASLEGVAVGAPETDDVPLGSTGARALVRPASRDHASFEWARMCRPATISTETRAEKNDDDDAPRVEAPPRAGWRRYAFPAETLALGHADTTGETLLECFLALLREGTLGLVRAASGLGDEHPEEKQKTATSDAEKNARLRVCLTADAFADAPQFAEHASRKKKHARLRRVLAYWLCPPTDAVERFAAGVATSAGETSARGIGIPRDAQTKKKKKREPKPRLFRATRRRARRTRRRSRRGRRRRSPARSRGFCRIRGRTSGGRCTGWCAGRRGARTRRARRPERPRLSFRRKRNETRRFTRCGRRFGAYEYSRRTDPPALRAS